MPSSLFLLLTVCTACTAGVNWNGNDWALACDFNNNDLSNARVVSSQCGGKCATTNGCTHFTWTSYNGGTCWMKKGPINKGFAFDVSDTTAVCGVLAIPWNGNNWASACTFSGGDFANAQVSSSQCGGRCATTSGCTHFSWTTSNGGSCWMKNTGASKNSALFTGDYTAMCGVATGSVVTPSTSTISPSSSGGGVGPVLSNVLATRHVNGGGDACALPTRTYAVNKPFALGDMSELAHLKFKPDLCGHVLNINCGYGPLDIIITNSNYGGGIDLYSQITWPIATNNQPPGQARCTVQLTNKNPLTGGSNQCFYKPGTGTSNPYYRNIGLLNTNAKIVTKATLNGQAGGHRGDNIYYAFDLGRAIDPSERVVFSFDDGSSQTVRFSDCVDVGSEQYWT